MAKILVADDERPILDVILETLESVGHEAVGVSDGLQALSLLKVHRFDLAILDIMMPKLDGYHLIAKIHGLDQAPKVLVMSSRRFDDDKATIKSLGVSAFLEKPFSKNDILDVVEKLLS